MDIKVKQQTIRRYIIGEKDLKESFEMKGKIDKIELWKGLSPNEEEKGKSSDEVEWAIITKEGDDL